MVTLVAFAVGAAAAAATWVLARRWPRFDPAAPEVDPAAHVDTSTVAAHPRLRLLLQSHIDPAAATGLVLTVAVTALVVCAVIVGALLAMVKTRSGFAHFDLVFARWGADHATRSSTSMMRRISLLGGTLGVVSVAVIVTIVELIRRPSKVVPIFVLLTVGGQFAVLSIVKAIVNRPRPDIERLTGFSGSSFPSGHATAAAATYALVALLIGRGRSRRARDVLAAVAVGIAVLVAASRVMLGVHWFTDVLAGLALGWGWLALCSISFGGRVLRFGQPVREAVKAVDALN